jgi:hypothetical protein
MSTLGRLYPSALCLCLLGCATTPPPLPEVLTNGIVWLHPIANPDLKLDTSGTVGPLLAQSSLDRGFGEYDNTVQSSLFLCAGTGPAAGACLAVMGGLTALAGATSSVIYRLQQGTTGQSATAITRAALTTNTTLSSLSARIAEQVGARAPTADTINVTTDPPAPACTLDGDGRAPRGVSALDIADLKLHFEPGYQFKLTIVARVRTQFCGGDKRTVERRLAYLGPVTAMSKDPNRARLALDAAVAIAVTSLSADVHRYLRDYVL